MRYRQNTKGAILYGPPVICHAEVILYYLIECIIIKK